MNRIYKVIWSRVKHCYVVVSEITKSAGKGISAVSGHSLCALVCAPCPYRMPGAGHGGSIV